MCKLSGKLKLCTCNATTVSRLQNYWVLHRFNAEKDVRVIGTMLLQDKLESQTEVHKRALLLERLHEPDAFDVDLQPGEGDRLQLTFQCTTPGRFWFKRTKIIT